MSTGLRRNACGLPAALRWAFTQFSEAGQTRQLPQVDVAAGTVHDLP